MIQSNCLQCSAVLPNGDGIALFGKANLFDKDLVLIKGLNGKRTDTQYSRLSHALIGNGDIGHDFFIFKFGLFLALLLMLSYILYCLLRTVIKLDMYVYVDFCDI